MMNRKLTLFTATALLLGASWGNAMPREKEHAECLAKASTDAAVTQCRTTEIEAVEKALKADEQNIRQEKSLQALAKKSGESIEDMRELFQSYAKSHCLYYVLANHGNGYSDAYNKAKCELADILQYQDNLQEIYQMAISDIKV